MPLRLKPPVCSARAGTETPLARSTRENNMGSQHPLSSREVYCGRALGMRCNNCQSGCPAEVWCPTEPLIHCCDTSENMQSDPRLGQALYTIGETAEPCLSSAEPRALPRYSCALKLHNRPIWGQNNSPEVWQASSGKPE